MSHSPGKAFQGYRVNLLPDGKIICNTCMNIKIWGIGRNIYGLLSDALRKVNESKEYTKTNISHKKVIDGLSEKIEQVINFIVDDTDMWGFKKKVEAKKNK